MEDNADNKPKPEEEKEFRTRDQWGCILLEAKGHKKTRIEWEGTVMLYVFPPEAHALYESFMRGESIMVDIREIRTAYKEHRTNLFSHITQ